MNDFRDFREHSQEEPRHGHALRRVRTDFPRRVERNHEEYAAEITPPNAVRMHNTEAERPDEESVSTGRTAGYVGLAFGIASLFMWSIILGPIAAVTGYYAYSQGSKGWGAWSMGLGILSTLSYFVLIPFAR
ncbi:hypothetical protein [Paenibacillus pini]|uniref:DUF4190 domain-containing protein n=1 Tax=Paenibacillus pini JCM 16418 TaxID=1236976 RepID=W7YXC5_9BACL|nr:hypothetical protein [Paenibacillus pini]GAF07054.1 hypothetical protein JCM16418_1041 [Paenibacillus pini JCM 16418]